MAHVREVARKDGTAYEVHWRQGETKKQRTFTVRREADRFALKVENEIAEGHSTDALVKNSKTVREIIEASLLASAPGLKLRTNLGYRAIYDNRIIPKFGARKASTVTRAEVQAWVVELDASGLAPATVHHHYVALKKAFRHAIHDRLLTYNPCDGVKLQKLQTVAEFAPVFLTMPQVEAIAKKLDEYAPYGLMIRFLAYTGLRAGELAGLRVDDLDFAAGTVHVRQTMQRVQGKWVVGTPKSKRSMRDVPLADDDLIADMRRYKMTHPRSGDPDALLWPGRKVGGVAEIDYWRVLDLGSFRRNYFRPVLRALGLKDMRVHDLRHTAASLWLAAGFEPWEVSRWLGHASITTTDTIYAHLYPSDFSRHRALFAALRAASTA